MSTENNKGMFSFFGKKSEVRDRGTGTSVTFAGTASMLESVAQKAA